MFLGPTGGGVRSGRLRIGYVSLGRCPGFAVDQRHQPALAQRGENIGPVVSDTISAIDGQGPTTKVRHGAINGHIGSCSTTREGVQRITLLLLLLFRINIRFAPFRTTRRTRAPQPHKFLLLTGEEVSPHSNEHFIVILLQGIQCWYGNSVRGGEFP